MRPGSVAGLGLLVLFESAPQLHCSAEQLGCHSASLNLSAPAVWWPLPLLGRCGGALQTAALGRMLFRAFSGRPAHAPSAKFWPKIRGRGERPSHYPVQSRLTGTLWTAAHQASPSITSSWSLLKFLSIELVMPPNHLMLGHPLLPPSVFASFRVFSSE